MRSGVRSHGGGTGARHVPPNPPGPGHENRASPYFRGEVGEGGEQIDSWESRILHSPIIVPIH